MSQSPPKLSVENLAVVVAARNHNPSILNPDFLKHNHIVPESWELAGAPICLEPLAQVAYAQSVVISAQQDRVSFSERIAGKADADIVVTRIAGKYVEILRHCNYHALGINPVGHAIMEGGADGARDFITMKYLSSEIRKCAQGSPVRSGIRLEFPAVDWMLNVKLDAGLAQVPGSAPMPVLIFEGNYHRDLFGATVEDRLKDLHSLLGEFPKLLGHFRSFASLALSL